MPSINKNDDEFMVPVFTGNPNVEAKEDTVTRSRLFAALHRINAVEMGTVSPLIMNLDMPAKIPNFMKYVMGVGYQFQRKFVRDLFDCIRMDPEELLKTRVKDNEAISLFQIRKSDKDHENYHQQNLGLFDDWTPERIDGIYYLCGLCLDYSQYANKAKKLLN